MRIFPSMAPCVRRCCVSARVSMPVMPGIFSFFIQSLRDFFAAKWENFSEYSLTMIPAEWILLLSKFESTLSVFLSSGIP